MRQRSSSLFTLAILAGVVFILTASGLSPSAIATTKQPNLQVFVAEVTGPEIVAQGHVLKLHWEDSTGNAGPATAGGSRTGYYLIPKAPPARFKGKAWKVETRAVSRLASGEVERPDAGVESETKTGKMPLGGYRLVICADAMFKVREANERDNCTSTGKFVYIYKKSWLGSVSGSAFGPDHVSAVETWNSLDAELKFAKYLGNGSFRYSFAGTVTWIDQGTDTGGCIFDGGITNVVDNADNNINGSYFLMEYGKGKYLANESSLPLMYDIAVTCPTASGTLRGPFYPSFLAFTKRPLSFDQEELKGHFAEAAFGTWTWDFT